MFSDDGKRSYHYGKLTWDNRLLIGYGDVKHPEEWKEGAVHEPHLGSIQRFIERVFPNLDVEIAFAWSERYALSTTGIPNVSIGKVVSEINGAGTQLASAAAASYVAAKLVGAPHALDGLWK